MNASRKVSALVEDSAQPASTTERPPTLIMPFGRGGMGKSVLLRWLADRAHNAGRDVVLADADRTNATLPAFYDGVLRPEYADDEAILEWLGAIVERQAGQRLNVLLDLGGGDVLMKNMAQRLRLARLLEGIGVRPVAIHLIGPAPDDLAVLRDIEESGAFCPPDTIVVFNEGLAPTVRPDPAYEWASNHEVVRKALDRGSILIRMPRLQSMHELDHRRLTFTQGELGEIRPGQRPIGLFARQAMMLDVQAWREAMEKAFEPVSGLLP